MVPAPHPRAASSTTFLTRAAHAGGWTPSTAAPCGRRMPAFSAAIRSTVSPRIATWSSPMAVITATWPAAGGWGGSSNTFVESRRPPRPVSTTATSTPSARKCANAVAVSSSNTVRKLFAPSALPASAPLSRARSSRIAQKRASGIGAPSTVMRSR